MKQLLIALFTTVMCPALAHQQQASIDSGAAAVTIDLKNYWPFPQLTVNNNLIENFVVIDAQGKKSPGQYIRYRLWSPPTDSMFTSDQFGPDGVWMGSEGLNLLSTGMVEFTDINGPFYTSQGFPPQVTFDIPIFWGNTARAGSQFGSQFHSNAWTPNDANAYWHWGWRTLNIGFIAASYTVNGNTYNNVVAMRDTQAVCNDSTCSSTSNSNAVYYLGQDCSSGTCQGIGIIQYDWYDSNMNYTGSFYLDKLCWGPDTQSSCP